MTPATIAALSESAPADGDTMRASWAFDLDGERTTVEHRDEILGLALRETAGDRDRIGEVRLVHLRRRLHHTVEGDGDLTAHAGLPSTGRSARCCNTGWRGCSRWPGRRRAGRRRRPTRCRRSARRCHGRTPHRCPAPGRHTRWCRRASAGSSAPVAVGAGRQGGDGLGGDGLRCGNGLGRERAPESGRGGGGRCALAGAVVAGVLAAGAVPDGDRGRRVTSPGVERRRRTRGARRRAAVRRRRTRRPRRAPPADPSRRAGRRRSPGPGHGRRARRSPGSRARCGSGRG